MRQITVSDGFTSSSAPSQGSQVSNAYVQYASDAAFVTAKGSAAAEPDVYYNTTYDLVRVFQNGAWRFLTGQLPSFASDADYVTAKGSAAENGDMYHDSAAKVIRAYRDSAWGYVTPTANPYPNSRVTKTTTYTLGATDTHVDCDTSGGAWTLTIPAAAAGTKGQTVKIRKTTSDLNALTTGTGYSTTLNTIGECIELSNNGTAWVLISRYVPSVPTSYTPTVGGCGIVTVNECKYTRLGIHALIEANVTCGTPSGSAFTFSLPSGLTLDYAQDTIVGQFGSSYTGGSNSGVTILASPSNSTSVVYYSSNNSSSVFTRLNGNTFNVGSGTFTVRFMVRITGWNG